MFNHSCIFAKYPFPFFQPAADLRQYNRAQVLYHALFNHLYVAEAELIEVNLGGGAVWHLDHSRHSLIQLQ